MINKKKFRVTIGIILLIILGCALFPFLYKYDAIDGIVNARTTTINSPIEGILHFNKDTKYGIFFKKGEVIGIVKNDRVEESFLHKLITEKKTLNARIKSLDKRIKNYKELKDSLAKNLKNYQKFSCNQLKSQIYQSTKKLKQEKEEYTRAKKEFDASKNLSERKVISNRELELHESNFKRSELKIIELQTQTEELQNSLKAVESGVFLSSGGNDSPYSKQRMDQMVIEISLAETGRDEAKDRVIGIEKQIVKEEERLKKAKVFEIKAPFDALVWRMIPTQGSSLVIDSEIIVLLDCSSIFLDVIVSETQFPNIKSGEQFKYRFFGESEFYQGEVIALRGSATVMTDKNLAASLIKDPKKEFHIWLAPEQGNMSMTPENFYQIGRRVEVRIPRKWDFEKPFVRLWNVF